MRKNAPRAASFGQLYIVPPPWQQAFKELFLNNSAMCRFYERSSVQHGTPQALAFSPETRREGCGVGAYEKFWRLSEQSPLGKPPKRRDGQPLWKTKVREAGLEVGEPAQGAGVVQGAPCERRQAAYQRLIFKDSTTCLNEACMRLGQRLGLYRTRKLVP